MTLDRIGINVQQSCGHPSLFLHFLHIGHCTDSIMGIVVRINFVELQSAAIGHGNIFLSPLGVVRGNFWLTKNKIRIYYTAGAHEQIQNSW